MTTESHGTPRVAVVGCGDWGQNLVRNFHQLGALAAIADADPARVGELGRRCAVPVLTYDEILAAAEIDGVVLATPAGLHARLALRALHAGKHVYIEKPLALIAADGEALLAAAADRVLMVGHLLRYHPAFVKLEELVGNGRLGRLQYIYSNRLNLGRIRREENVFWSFAPHDLSMILALAGDLPERVQAVGSCYLHKSLFDVTTTHLTFANGINAHIFVSWLHPFKEQKLVVIGDGGMAVFDDGLAWSDKLTLYPHQVDWVDGSPQPTKAEGQPIAVAAAEPLGLECRHFLDCIATGRRPRTDGAEGLRVLRVLDAAEQSMQRGQVIAMPRVVPAPAGRPAGRHSDLPGVAVHESAYVDDGCTIGPGTRIWHFSHILAGCRIGRDCTIGQNVMIGPGVTVGDRCKIQNNVSIYRGVTLEEGVFCGPSAVFTNVINPRAEVERKDEFRPTHVGRGATIGANATIVCGHRIGAYGFVAAGAVVTSDVAPHALVAGVPARQIGWMSHSGERLGEDLVCPRSGRHYRALDPDQLVAVDELEVTSSHG